MKNKKIQQLIFAIVLCLTLGLAPFTPEPHLTQKWRWLADGAIGMNAMDWFDLVLHSSPIAFLAFTLLNFIRFRENSNRDSAEGNL